MGGNLYASELAYLAEHEYARTAEDVLWRRNGWAFTWTTRGRTPSPAGSSGTCRAASASTPLPR